MVYPNFVQSESRVKEKILRHDIKSYKKLFETGIKIWIILMSDFHNLEIVGSW